MDNISKLKSLAQDVRILYVEDNEALRVSASRLFYKFFKTVDIAMDGEEGLKQFKKHHHSLVVTDIKMPNMDGITLSKKIKGIQPSTHIIILSAFDDKENLNKAIETGVYRFLKKPINIHIFVDVLYDVITRIKDEIDSKKFNQYIDSYFNYQSSMALIVKDFRPIIANQSFLEFFKVDDIESFINSYGDIGMLFLEHEGFLYNKLDKTYCDELSKSETHPYNTIIKKRNGDIHHIILKYQKLPEGDGFGILSFEDVTELKLLSLIDRELDEENDTKFIKDSLKKKEIIFDTFKEMKEEGIEIELHNFYKGLSITNKASIEIVRGDSIVVKTSQHQQKAIEIEKNTIITSDKFLYAVESLKVSSIGLDVKYIELQNLRLVPTSPVTRRSIRVEPEDEYSVSFFVSGKKFNGSIVIEDISIESVKLRLDSLPAGLDSSDNVNIEIDLELNEQPFTLAAKVKIFRKKEEEDSFMIVCIFENLQKAMLIKYITKRQMAIIREFKGL